MMISICINPVVVQDQEEEELQKDTICSEILMIGTTTTDLHNTMACVRAAQERGSMITTMDIMVPHHPK